ncbi:MAG: hypothetical protein ACXV3T_05715 [Halobacteriota archaeon]
MDNVSQRESQSVDSAKLVLVPNAFVPPGLQQWTESQVQAIIDQMNEIKSKREELEIQAQKEINKIGGERVGTSREQSPVHSSKLRRIWKTMDALFERVDALEQVYFVYKLAASGLRWISPSELADIPEDEAMTVIEVLHGKAAYIEGYKQYATHDVRVVLQCIKSSAGKVCLLHK